MYKNHLLNVTAVLEVEKEPETMLVLCYMYVENFYTTEKLLNVISLCQWVLVIPSLQYFCFYCRIALYTC